MAQRKKRHDQAISTKSMSTTRALNQQPHKSVMHGVVFLLGSLGERIAPVVIACRRKSKNAVSFTPRTTYVRKIHLLIHHRVINLELKRSSLALQRLIERLLTCKDVAALQERIHVSWMSSEPSSAISRNDKIHSSCGAALVCFRRRRFSTMFCTAQTKRVGPVGMCVVRSCRGYHLEHDARLFQKCRCAWL